MTDSVAQPCVRGCVQPCRCEACKTAPQPVHGPVPRPQDVGLLCQRCADQLRTWVGDLVPLYATLTLEPEHTGEREGKRGKLSGSPALVRLDVLALQDPRTRRDDEGGPLAVEFTTSSWAGCLREELFPPPPVDDEEATNTYTRNDTTGTLAGAVNFLTIWWTGLLAQTWIDEFYRDVELMNRTLRRAHGIQNPKPIGHCLEMVGTPPRRCGRALYAPAVKVAATSQTAGYKGRPVERKDQTAPIRCPSCGRRYDGINLIRLRGVEMQETGQREGRAG